MGIDIHVKSEQLLNAISNSMLDRDPDSKPVFFSIFEIQMVEKWINELIEEIEE